MSVTSVENAQTITAQTVAALKIPNVQDVYPLSPMQQGMLFHSLLEPGAGVYFVELSCRIDSRLDVSAFRRAWEEVLRRHAVLRTAFMWEGLNKPMQVVRERVELPWKEEDWRGQSECEQQQRWEQFLREERRRGFDLKQAPLMRLTLVRIGDQSYYFAWNSHHILLDGWCRQILMGEALVLYDAYRAGQAPQMKTPRPYRDYIAWLQTQDQEQAESFWREELKGFTAPTRLGMEQEIRELDVDDVRFGILTTPLSAELTEKLDSLARTQQVTVNTVVQAAWALILSCYSRERDVVFGATVSGRAGAQGIFQETVGLFINTLPVRIKLQNQESISSYLKRLYKRQALASEYEYFPLLKVQTASEVPRGTPLFESIFVFDNYPVDANLGKGVAAGMNITVAPGLEMSNYPLGLNFSVGMPANLLLEYDRRMFAAQDVERLFAHLVTVFGEMTVPERCVGNISLLTEAERLQLLAECDRPETEFASRCIHHIFEQQAQQTPNAVAVEDDSERIIYQQLNSRANQWAHYLLALGVGPDVRVGICMRRSVRMIEGLLGILKAGGAYVPLDADYPQERLAYMMQEAQVTVLLAQKELLPRLPSGQFTVVCLEEGSEVISRQPLHNPLVPLTADNLAYVIYTSGSTGQPKGTEVPHRSIPGFIFNVDYVRFGADSVLFQHSAVNWDALTLELWPALLTGGRSVLYRGHALTAPDLRDYISRYGVNTLWITSALFNTIMDTDAESFSGIRDLMVGGEALSMAHIRRVLKVLPEIQIVNGYGPSECTVFSNCHVIERPLGMETPAIPIGRAIGDRRVYVVDPSLNLRPVGVPGEICIAGRSVARGYLKQAALTAEKFLPNPFSEKSGDRLYCTGDLAVRRVDGRLEFMGRLDHQVKVRGYRIELGEIEATLQNHEQIKHAVVIVQEDAVRGKRLVAHVVGNNETGSLVSAELRKYLEERLPDYMVPSAFVVLKELPLLATGKIDRKALLEPPSGTSEIDVVPSDEMELKLTTIWEDLLGVSHVGRRQSFFELGGHSLLAIKLVRRIKEQFGQELPLSIFLEHPTIEQMSIVLRQSAGPVVRSNLVPIHARGSKRPLFFIHPGGGGVAGYRHLARLLGDDQPFYGLQALDDEENRREDIISVEERATMYLKNLREAQPQGPYLVGGWSFGGYVAYEMARQLVQQKEEMAGVILFDISARPPTQPPSDGDDAEQLLELAKQTADLGLALLPKEIHGPQERLQNLVDQLIAAGILMPETDLSQVGNFIRGLRRRILSIINYKPGPYSGTVVLVRALEVDPVVSTDYDPNDPTLGFARLCSEPVQVHFVPGRHGNLIFSPQVEKVAEVVKESLRELELRVCSPVCTT